MLVEYPEKVEKKLLNILKPVDLHSVTVYLIFKAGNDIQNDNYNLMSKLFKKILEDAGAKVKIGANLIPDN